MKVIGVSLLCGMFVAAAAAPAGADELDDLLAGKPVVTAKASSSATQFESSLEAGITSGVDAATLAEGAGWEVTVKHAPQPNAADDATQPAPPSVPPSDVSLVPEPSAIVLGVAAILYFLIFFRRRQLP